MWYLILRASFPVFWYMVGLVFEQVCSYTVPYYSGKEVLVTDASPLPNNPLKKTPLMTAYKTKKNIYQNR